MLRQSLVLETCAVKMSNSYAEPRHGLALCSKFNTGMPLEKSFVSNVYYFYKNQKAAKFFIM